MQAKYEHFSFCVMLNRTYNYRNPIEMWEKAISKKWWKVTFFRNKVLWKGNFFHLLPLGERERKKAKFEMRIECYVKKLHLSKNTLCIRINGLLKRKYKNSPCFV